MGNVRFAVIQYRQNGYRNNLRLVLVEEKIKSPNSYITNTFSAPYCEYFNFKTKVLKGAQSKYDIMHCKFS